MDLSLDFFRCENRKGLEANFAHWFEANGQLSIFENKCTKFDRETTYFRAKKPKTQVITPHLESHRG